MTTVYAVPFHVKRMENSIMPPNLTDAYVRCYAAGGDHLDATRRAFEKLASDGLYAAEIRHPILTIESTGWFEHIHCNWPEHESLLPTQNEFEDAIGRGKVVYGPFGSYHG